MAQIIGVDEINELRMLLPSIIGRWLGRQQQAVDNETQRLRKALPK
jgi:hypothetical protein